MRRVLKWLALAAAALLLLSAGLYLLVRSPYGQQRLKAEVIGAVEGRLNARLSVGRVSGNPLRGLTFHGVRLTLPEGGEVLAAQRLRVGYSLARLLLTPGGYHLSLTVEGFRLNVVREADGRFNLQRLLKPRVGPPRLVLLDDIRLGGGRVRLALEGGRPRDYLLEDLAARAQATVRTGPRPEVSLRLEGASFALVHGGRVEVSRLSGTGRIKAGGPLSADLLLQTKASRLRLSAQVRPGGDYLSVTASAAPLALKDVDALWPGLAGQGELRAEASLAGPRGATHLKAGLALGRARLTAEGILDLSSLAAPRGGLTIRVRDLDPAAVSPAARKAGLTGALNADLRLEEAPAGGVAVRATVLPSRLRGHEITSGRLAATLTRGRLTLERAELAAPVGRLSASGEVSDIAALRQGPLTATLAGQVQSLNLAPLTGKRGLSSSLGARFSATAGRRAGAPLRVAGSLKLERGSLLSGYRLQAGSLAAAYSAGRLEVSRLRLASPLLSLEAGGSASGERLAVSWSLRSEDVGRLLNALKPEVQGAGGRLALRGSVGGSPAAPAVDLRAEGAGLRYHAYLLRQLRATLRLDDARRPREGSFSLRAAGLSSAGQRRLESVSAEGLLRAGVLGFSAAAVAGRERSLRLSGSATNLSLKTAEVRLSQVRLSLPGLSVANSRPLSASISPRGWSLSNVALAASDGTLGLTGGVAQTLDLTLDVRALPLARWLPKGAPVAGSATGRLHLAGTLAEPRLAGQVSLTGAALQPAAGKAVALERAEARLSYAAGRLRLEGLLAHEGNPISASGTVPVTLRLWPPRAALGESGLNLVLRAPRFDLAALKPLLAANVEVSGTLSATLAATGDPRRPDVEGRAGIEEGALYAPRPPLALRHVQARLSFNRDRVVVERLEADSNGGRVEVRGQMGLRGAMPLELSVAANDFRVSIPEESWARVNAGLRVAGTRQAPTVEGSMRVLEAKIVIPQRLVPSLREIRVVETLEELKRPEPSREGLVQGLQRSVALDVGLKASGGVRVVGRGLDAEFRLDMKALKERGGALRLLGTANVVRGTYSVRNKRLVIEQAQAVFGGEPSLNPELSARLTYEAQAQTTIVVSVSGTVSKPQIQFSSEPPMEQANVYSYLFFGQPAEKLGGGEQKVLQQQVAGLVGGAAAQEVTGVLGQELAIDTFQVTPAEGELGIETVSVGKYLTRDLFVTFQRSFGVEQGNQVLLNYRLSRRFSLQSQFGAERTTGFDIFWNYDFSYLFR